MMNIQLQKKIKIESGDNDSLPPPPPPPFPGVPRQLYEDILDHLFSLLSIKEAVQVGTITKRFKNSWHHNQMLLFGSDFERLNQQELVDVVEKVFKFNRAPEIHAFCLHINPRGIEDSINQWLGLCVVKRIKDLELQFSEPFCLESHILDIQTLQTLKLTNCHIQIQPPPHNTINGLKFLKIIFLARLHLYDYQLESLISNCKLLNTLEISECVGLKVINISVRDNENFTTIKIAYIPTLEDICLDVPSLRSISYSGAVIKIQFQRALPLKEAYFKFFPARGYLLTHKVDRLVVDLLYVTVLTTTSTFIEPLSPRMRDGVYREALFCLVNVRELHIIMEGGIFCNPCDIAVFLKSCPSLETLFIDLYNYNLDCGLYWKLNEKAVLDNFPHSFYQLKFVKLIGFKFAEYEIELVKVLLQRSVNLEAMVFILPNNHRTWVARASDAAHYNQLFRSWIVSPRARLFVYEHGNDKTISPTHPKL